MLLYLNISFLKQFDTVLNGPFEMKIIFPDKHVVFSQNLYFSL
ncbi:hypothetical protein NEIELOOT_03172, partial [Neisseria elongata subsp. glycolytica ATCC 29315]